MQHVGTRGNAKDIASQEQLTGLTASQIHAATSKATPVDADELGLSDSAASWGLKKITWANLKAVLLAYFKGQFREKLTSARTYYVRADGSDSNDGLTNISGGAFLTIQKAVNVAATLDNGSFDITISVIGTGHAGFVFKSPVGSGNLIVAGSGRTTSSVTSVLCDVPGRFTLRDIAVSNGVTVRPGAALSGSNLNLSSSGQCLRVDGQFLGSGVIEFVGAAQHAIYAAGGNCQLTGVDLRVSSASYSVAFCEAAAISIVNFFSSTVTGSATGKRYIASSNSVMFAGAGPTFLPGNVAGTVDTGGQYL